MDFKYIYETTNIYIEIIGRRLQNNIMILYVVWLAARDRGIIIWSEQSGTRLLYSIYYSMYIDQVVIIVFVNPNVKIIWFAKLMCFNFF